MLVDNRRCKSPGLWPMACQIMSKSLCIVLPATLPPRGPWAEKVLLFLMVVRVAFFVLKSMHLANPQKATLYRTSSALEPNIDDFGPNMGPKTEPKSLQVRLQEATYVKVPKVYKT